MKVLVTGATGFIGREIVSELTGNNIEVLALSRAFQIENFDGFQDEKVVWYQKDITERQNWSDLEKIPNVEAIIHSAGLAHQFGETKKEEFDRVNVSGTENVLNLGVQLKIKHFILIGSTAVYSNAASVRRSRSGYTLIDETADLQPPTLYAASKLAGEQICRRVCEQNNIPLTIFRLAPVIGEDNTGNVSRLIRAIDKNRFIWIGDGRNLKSLIYKKDVARACYKLLLSKNNRTEIFNLAAEPIIMQDFVEQIAAHLCRKVFPVPIPARLPRMFFQFNAKFTNFRKINKISETIEKWLADDVYSTNRIERAYNFKTSTAIPDAIERQVRQYKIKSSSAE